MKLSDLRTSEQLLADELAAVRHSAFSGNDGPRSSGGDPAPGAPDSARLVAAGARPGPESRCVASGRARTR